MSTDDLRYIRSTTGRVHVLPAEPTDSPAAPIADGDEFAAMVLAPTRMACGAAIHIDWTGGKGRRAQPVGEFDDVDLCSRCVMALGTEAEWIFDRDSAWR